VKNAAKVSADIEKEDGEQVREIDVTTRSRQKKAVDAVVDEARKGFDLLVVGMNKVIGSDGGFDRNVEIVTAGFDGPLAVVAAKGHHLTRPDSDGLKSWCRCPVAAYRGAAPKWRWRWRAAAAIRCG
jgi:hypothetical protein